MRTIFLAIVLAVFCMSPGIVSARPDAHLAAVAGKEIVDGWYAWCDTPTGRIIIGTKYRPLSPPLEVGDSWGPRDGPPYTFEILRRQYCRGLVRFHVTDFVETKPSQ